MAPRPGTPGRLTEPSSRSRCSVRAIDVLLMPGFFTNLDENWRIPEIADTHRRIGTFARVIAMDRRGMGLSDRLSPDDGAPLETHVDDVVAVLDAVGARDVCIVTSESGAPILALLFAAAHPDRVRRPCPLHPDPEQPTRLARHRSPRGDGCVGKRGVRSQGSGDGRAVRGGGSGRRPVVGVVSPRGREPGFRVRDARTVVGDGRPRRPADRAGPHPDPHSPRARRTSSCRRVHPHAP